MCIEQWPNLGQHSEPIVVRTQIVAAAAVLIAAVVVEKASLLQARVH